MAAFCKYCGKPLQDGEICTCPQAQAEAARMYQGQQPPQGYQQPPQGCQQPPQGYQLPPQGCQQPPQGYQQPPQSCQQPPQGYQQPPQGCQQPPQDYRQPQQPTAPNPVAVALRKVVPYLKSYFTAPVSAARDLMTQKDIALAAVLLCVQAIAGGLLLFSMVGSYLKNLPVVIGTPVLALLKPLIGNRIYSDLMDLTDSMEGPDLDTLDIRFSASFPMSLLFGILATAAAVAVFVLIAFAVSKLAGSGRSIQDTVVIAAAHTPMVTALLLLSFLFFLFVMPLGVIFLALATLTWVVLAVPALQTLAPNAAQGRFWISAIVGILAALLIGGWAAYTIGSASVGSATCRINRQSCTIKELREDVEDTLDRLGDMEFDDLMDLMGRFF